MIDLGELSFKQRQLELCDCFHHCVVLGDDSFQPTGRRSQLVAVSVT